MEIQRELAERNAALPDDCRMLFRIGINLGEVVVEKDARGSRTAMARSFAPDLGFTSPRKAASAPGRATELMAFNDAPGPLAEDAARQAERAMGFEFDHLDGVLYPTRMHVRGKMGDIRGGSRLLTAYLYAHPITISELTA